MDPAGGALSERGLLLMRLRPKALPRRPKARPPSPDTASTVIF